MNRDFEHVPLLIFGGSFDPPHIAHVLLPLLAAQKLGIPQVLFVPTGIPPHKPTITLTPAHHRLAMLRLALANVPMARICHFELERARTGQVSYTVETLEYLKGQFGRQKPLYLLIGSDQLPALPSWKNWKRILELAEPVVMLRPPDQPDKLLTTLPPELSGTDWSSRLLRDLPELGVSASDIRQAVAEGRAIHGLVHPDVEAYIRRHGLYR